MTPEASKFAEQAHIMLRRARIMLGAGLNEDAARAAYMACFHLSQAYIFERSSKVSKSHKGVQVAFFKLSKDDTRVDPDLRRFLAQAYDFKSVADYFTHATNSTSKSDAEAAVVTAERFVAHFIPLVPQCG